MTGRIDKPYRYYEPLKGADSREYPRIDLVKTTVQRGNANYFGRYIEEAIRSIPEAHIEEAIENLQEATELYLEEFPLKQSFRPILTTFEVPAHA